MENHAFIITVYQQSPYLEACVQSLVGQTIKSEIIITTPTPTEYTKSIAEKYAIPYIVNNTDNTHVSNSWNFALSQANARLVTLAHQDDIYEPAYAETVISKFSEYNKKNIQIAFTNYTDIVNDTARKISLSSAVKSSLLMPFFFKSTISSRFFKKLILLFGNPICCPSVTFNMHAINKFSFSADRTSTVDWYAWYSLAQQSGSFLYINQKLIKRRIHLQSDTTTLLKNGVTLQDEYKMFELMWGSKRFARIISGFYAAGHKDNQT